MKSFFTPALEARSRDLASLFVAPSFGRWRESLTRCESNEENNLFRVAGGLSGACSTGSAPAAPTVPAAALGGRIKWQKP